MAYMDADWYVVRDSQGIVIQNNREVGGDRGGWIRMPLEDFDALVFMRFAQLTVEDPDTNLFHEPFAAKVCEQHPNLGSEALRKLVGLPPLTES